LLCYFRHTTSTNPYQRVGYQDITSHVNFSALVKKGEAIGLQKVGYTEQYKFLAALGLLAELEDLERNSGLYSAPDFLRNKLAMKNFLVPEGMGTLYKVLAQGKSVGEVELSGFRDPFRRPKDST
jgi:SAM-dependent MidA family methyltransferase